MTPETKLSRLGWQLETAHFADHSEYRASCGGFFTPYRESAEATLNDVLAYKCKENAEAVGQQKARF